MAGTLPEDFADLEPFVERFALATTAERAARRSESTPAERQAFYDAMNGRVAAALDYLDSRPLDALTAAEQNLMNLALGFAHVTISVEVQGPDEQRHAELRKTMRITHSPSDAAA